MEAVNPISLTRRLLACNTINPPGIERNCAKFLSGLLEDRGFKVRLTEFAENRTSVIACLADDLEKLLLGFSGHMDTVPLGSAKWRKDPFGGDLDGDKLYGRGAADMKGGLSAIRGSYGCRRKHPVLRRMGLGRKKAPMRSIKLLRRFSGCDDLIFALHRILCLVYRH